MDVFVRQSQESDIEKIKPYIEEYGLDDENMDYHQFYIAEINNELVGFGRIKNYNNIYELATIGVIEPFRKNGIGKKIIKELINAAPSKEIWITTIIPEYFEQFGFADDNNIPEEILLKCARVCGSLNKTTQKSRYMCYKKIDF